MRVCPRLFLLVAVSTAGALGGCSTEGDTPRVADVSVTADVPSVDGGPEVGAMDVPVSIDPGPEAVPDDAPSDEPESPDCGCEPPTVTVTVNDIPDSMNGSRPFLFNALNLAYLQGRIIVVPKD